MARLNIQNNVSLARLTTFKVGGPARYFVEVMNEEELQLALTWAEQNQQKILVLGRGSNLIVSLEGFPGLVIRLEMAEYQVKGQRVEAGAAADMKDLVNASIEAGLRGLEWAGGLPGTIGGAVRGNAGAFSGEIKDVVYEVKAINQLTGEVRVYDKESCRFGYRDSFFKHNPEVIFKIILWLKPGDKTKLRHIADDHIQYRQDKHPMEYPNSGSIFKNVPVENVSPKVKKMFESSIKTDPFPVIPAAKIIAEAGLKGLSIGGAQVSDKHTNYIINTGKATGEDIVELIRKIQSVVRQKYQVALEVEPELVGF